MTQTQNIISADSWTVIPPDVAFKEIDRSGFLHRGTGIPIEIRPFFQISDMVKGERRNIVLQFEGTPYEAYFSTTGSVERATPQARLFWMKDFTLVIQNAYPDHYSFYENAEDKKAKPYGLEIPNLYLQKDQETPGLYIVSFDDPRLAQAVEETDEADYQRRVQSKKNVKIREDKPKNKPDPSFKKGRKSWDRDENTGAEAMAKAEYRCEMDANHLTFISRKTGQNFVEAHHLIPISLQDQFDYSLDVTANIVSLCPNCHKKIHHARYEDQEQMITLLYQQRKDRLRTCGIEMDMQRLFHIYKSL
ncbi:HNH endonuclease [Brevibacillus dissolubilis]|uniref:HNH endonuclease n=1 Tax=Brevibacillus dissolubilis TaxID=1844116 RepID=UPI0011164B62|nr:HNH endonuclease [Brevibacillus dissolubilis]